VKSGFFTDDELTIPFRVVPVMAAVATTVHNTLGKRFYSLPMSPPKALAEEIARIRSKPDCQ